MECGETAPLPPDKAQRGLEKKKAFVGDATQLRRTGREVGEDLNGESREDNGSDGGLLRR